MAAVFAPRALLFLAPHVLLVICLLAAPKLQVIAGERELLFTGAAGVVLVFTALLSLYFNRSRVLFSSVLMLLVLLAGMDAVAGQNTLLAAPAVVVGIVVPFNLLLMSLVRERGTLSLPAILLFALLLLQVLVIGWCYGDCPVPPPSPPDIAWSWWPDWLWKEVPGLVALGVGIAAMVMLGRALWSRNAIDSALLALLVVFVMTWVNPAGLPGSALLFTVVAVILLLAVIQDFYDMAYRDDLTRLRGRRALNEYLLRLGRNYSIAMIDVDHFKRFNDRYGHDTGDQVLRMVGAQLSRATGGGRAFRYGGEEFTLVFPNKPLAMVKPHLEALRESIADYPMAIRSKVRPKRSKEGRKSRRRNKNARDTVAVTVSIGLAQRSAESRLPEDVIKAADAALYKAKRGGRNKVCAS